MKTKVVQHVPGINLKSFDTLDKLDKLKTLQVPSASRTFRHLFGTMIFSVAAGSVYRQPATLPRMTPTPSVENSNTQRYK